MSLRLCFFVSAQMAEIAKPYNSNGPGNLGNWGSSEEIQPESTNIPVVQIVAVFFKDGWSGMSFAVKVKANSAKGQLQAAWWVKQKH